MSGLSSINSSSKKQCDRENLDALPQNVFSLISSFGGKVFARLALCLSKHYYIRVIDSFFESNLSIIYFNYNIRRFAVFLNKGCVKFEDKIEKGCAGFVELCKKDAILWINRYDFYSCLLKVYPYLSGENPNERRKEDKKLSEKYKNVNDSEKLVKMRESLFSKHKGVLNQTIKKRDGGVITTWYKCFLDSTKKWKNNFFTKLMNQNLVLYGNNFFHACLMYNLFEEYCKQAELKEEGKEISETNWQIVERYTIRQISKVDLAECLWKAFCKRQRFFANTVEGISNGFSINFTKIDFDKNWNKLKNLHGWSVFANDVVCLEVDLSKVSKITNLVLEDIVHNNVLSLPEKFPNLKSLKFINSSNVGVLRKKFPPVESFSVVYNTKRFTFNNVYIDLLPEEEKLTNLCLDVYNNLSLTAGNYLPKTPFCFSVPNLRVLKICLKGEESSLELIGPYCGLEVLTLYLGFGCYRIKLSENESVLFPNLKQLAIGGDMNAQCMNFETILQKVINSKKMHSLTIKSDEDIPSETPPSLQHLKSLKKFTLDCRKTSTSAFEMVIEKFKDLLKNNWNDVKCLHLYDNVTHLNDLHKYLLQLRGVSKTFQSFVFRPGVMIFGNYITNYKKSISYFSDAFDEVKQFLELYKKAPVELQKIDFLTCYFFPESGRSVRKEKIKAYKKQCDILQISYETVFPELTITIYKNSIVIKNLKPTC